MVELTCLSRHVSKVNACFRKYCFRIADILLGFLATKILQTCVHFKKDYSTCENSLWSINVFRHLKIAHFIIPLRAIAEKPIAPTDKVYNFYCRQLEPCNKVWIGLFSATTTESPAGRPSYDWEELWWVLHVIDPVLLLLPTSSTPVNYSSLCYSFISNPQIKRKQPPATVKRSQINLQKSDLSKPISKILLETF